MSMHQRMEARQQQSLVMTPQLQQAIKLLQLNHIELQAHIQEALMENPTLQEVPDTGGAERDGERKLEEAGRLQQQDLAEQENRGDKQGMDWDAYMDQALNQGKTEPRGSAGTIFEELPPMDANLTYGESLVDHLSWQLAMLRCSDEERAMAEVILLNLDERGYLEVPLESLVEEAGVSMEVAEDALHMVQDLEPVGCGSRDLCECLLVQAKVHFPEDTTFEPILRFHMGDLERKNYGAIAKALQLEVEDVQEYHRMIQDLEPMPGRAYSATDPRYITPDVYVFKSGDDWRVQVNDEGIPDLGISKYYRSMIKQGNKEVRDYVIEKLKSAEFLIQSIHKRRHTIVRVMESILKFQHEFFEFGASRLRPLVLQDVADEIINPKTGKPLHMSTVSRATSNKYVHTPHGIFELKYFFSAAVPQHGGGDLAAEAIKARIKQLIGDENPKEPLSDQALADMLKGEGIDVARRTVAKYREALGVLTSSKRKAMF